MVSAERGCTRCGCLLSRYNGGDYCGGCTGPVPRSGGFAGELRAGQVGSQLRSARLRRGMTLRVLADFAGVTPAYLSMIENGKRRLDRYSRIAMLADALGIAPAELMHGTDRE